MMRMHLKKIIRIKKSLSIIKVEETENFNLKLYLLKSKIKEIFKKFNNLK